MTGGNERGVAGEARVSEPDSLAESRGRRDRAGTVLSRTLADRDAAAFVHVGTERDPGITYSCPRPSTGLTAVAYDGSADEWVVRSAADASRGHPAEGLAAALADRGLEGKLLTPPRVPHDAALYLEQSGFELASTDALERARATKTAGEQERVAAAQRAATAGIRRAAAVLAEVTVVDGRLAVDASDGGEPEPLTPARLRTAIDKAIVGSGACPAGNTAVTPGSSTDSDHPLRPGDPIVLKAAPRGPAGYYGGLVRTLVVDSDGGRERRVHVGVTQSFRSVRSMLTAGTESVTAVEADLEAEVRSFGFSDGDGIETRVAGVGLESRERPVAGGDEIGPGTVVRLDVAARVEADQWIRIADLMAINDEDERPDWLAAPSQSLSPTALLD